MLDVGITGIHKIKEPLSILLIESGGVKHFDYETLFKKTYRELFSTAFPDASIHRFYPLTTSKDRKYSIEEQALTKYIRARDNGDLPEGCDKETFIENPHLRLLPAFPSDNLEDRTVLLFDDCVTMGNTMRRTEIDLRILGIGPDNLFYHTIGGIKRIDEVKLPVDRIGKPY